MQLSNQLKNAYSNQYTTSVTDWRNLGAKYKAKNILELSSGLQIKKICEIGCGEGSILEQLAAHNFAPEMYGLEISESGIALTNAKHIKNLKNISIFDGYHIPYEDDAFDLVVCSHVIEHVEHPRILLREIKRVSKYQIFEVPIDFSFYVDKKINHFLSYGHINIFTPALFRFLLLSEGFSIIKDKKYLQADEILQYLFKNNKKNYMIVKMKQFLLKLFPYLLGIKPSAYVVLTKTDNSSLEIFK